MKVEGLKYVLEIRDMDRAVDFYATCFDLEVRFKSPDWSDLARGEAGVGLHPGAPAEGVRETGLSFTVDDLDEAAERVRSNGGQVRKEPYANPGEGIRLALFIDPEGNAFMGSQNLGSWS